MDILAILPDTNPLLKCKSIAVERFDRNLAHLAKQMINTMTHANGYGLAAPQIGVACRMFVVHDAIGISEQVVINPVITHSSGYSCKGEGCLSSPGLNLNVERSAVIDVKYQNISGEEHTQTLKGLPAIVFQHELDHLDGILFTDRVHPDIVKAAMKKLAKGVKK